MGDALSPIHVLATANQISGAIERARAHVIPGATLSAHQLFLPRIIQNKHMHALKFNRIGSACVSFGGELRDITQVD